MHLRWLAFNSLLVACLLSWHAGDSCAQTPETPVTPSISDKHAWAQFGVGSWKLVRVYTETLGANGQVEGVSITETKTTLDMTDDKGYALKVEVTVEVAGKRFQAEPKYVAYGYHGESQGQVAEVQQVGTGEIEICGKKYPINTRRIVIKSDASQSTSILEYSDTVSPYNLKRTTESVDLETKTRNYHSVVEVLAVDMPEKVLTEYRSASHTKTIETFGNGLSKVTLEVHSDSVPGGVVSHAMKELDSDGRITKRSTLELLDYGVVGKPVAAKQLLPVRRRILSGRRRN